MKFLTFIATFIVSTFSLFSQQWVDTTFQITTVNNIEYGESVDFAGVKRVHFMDISFPTNDSPPECGRPLIVVVHGGAWLAGSKDELTIKRLREDYAKRGYTSIAVNYRLGQFHTDKNIHCNVEGWDCFNIADSSEWYRAYYRAIQDVNGSIRYMVNNSEEYNIDPNNIFLAGESAGAFTAIGVGFIDSNNDVLTQYTKELPAIAAPNTLYEEPCIKELNIASSIEEMKLERPDLGSYEGEMNQPTVLPYKIRGVAGFYGGVMNNIFNSPEDESPALYIFHQPNDLIVPVGYGTVFEGYNDCTRDVLNCQNIVNRKSVWGSRGIANIIDTMESKGLQTPDYILELTNNNANCFEQLVNPSKGGHQYDNYWQRSTKAAAFLADYITECTVETGVNDDSPKYKMYIYPNPLVGNSLSIINGIGTITLTDSFGRVLLESENRKYNYTIDINQFNLSSGLYYIKLITDKRAEYLKFIVQ